MSHSVRPSVRPSVRLSVCLCVRVSPSNSVTLGSQCTVSAQRTFDLCICIRVHGDWLIWCPVTSAFAFGSGLDSSVLKEGLIERKIYTKLQ